MAKIIGKTEDNKDIYGVDFDFEFKTVKYEEGGKRIVSLVASTPSVDRDGDSINQKGWDLKYYRKNPVILWAHNHGIPAIGRGNKFAIREDKLVFEEIEFPKEGIHPQADMIFSLMQDKFIRACSVGFLPTKYSKREREDGEPEIGWCPTNFEKQELLELSVCNVGCNREALSVNLTSKGFRSRQDATGNLYDVDKFVEELTEGMDEPESDSEIEKEAPERKEDSDAGLKVEAPSCEKESIANQDDTNSESSANSLSKESEELLVAKIQEAKESLFAELEKAGAVLSRTNKEKLKNAVEAINAVLAAAEPATVDEGLSDDKQTQPPEEVSLKDVVGKLDLILQEVKKPLETIQPDADIIDLAAIDLPKDINDKSAADGGEEIDLETLSKALTQIKQDYLGTVKETVQAEFSKAMGIVD